MSVQMTKHDVSDEAVEERQEAVSEDGAEVSAYPKTHSGMNLSRFRPSRLLDSFARWFYTFVTSGFFGMLLTAYTREENFFRRFFAKRKKQKKIHRQPKYIDHRVATFTEKLFFTSFLKRIRYALLKSPIGYYRDCILLYALVSLLGNYLYLFFSSAPSLYTGESIANYAQEAFQTYSSEPSFWVHLILFVLVAVFFFPIRAYSLQEVKMGSRFLSAFFGRLLGVKGELTEELRSRESSEKGTVQRNRLIHILWILLGAGTGVLSIFVSPFAILMIPALCLMAAIVIVTPEAGLVLSVLLLPVLIMTGRYDTLYTTVVSDGDFGKLFSAIGIPTLFLTALVLFTGFSYLIKVLRKKRLFRFGLLDAAVLLFGATVLFYGVYPAVNAASLTEAVLTFVLIMVYFLAVNLLRTEAWINRVLAVLQFTLFLMLSLGIFVYYFGIPDLGWISTEHVAGEIGNISAFFGGESALGAYLVLMFPMTLGTVFCVRSVLCKIFAAMCIPEILFVSLLLPSQLPFTFCLFGLVVFSLFCTYKALYTVPLACLGAGVVYQLIPNGTNLGVFLKVFLRETFGKAVYLWDRLFLVPYELSLAGEGFGQVRFSALFVKGDPYTESGFWMQMLFSIGIPGIIVFLVFAVIFCQMCFEELRLSKGSHLRVGLVGGFSSIAVMLGYGLFMPIFTDFRITFLFWLCIGVVTAYRQVSSGRRNDRSFLRQDPMTARNADTIIY